MPILLAISRLLTPSWKSLLTSVRVPGDRLRPAVRAAFLACLGDPGPHAIAEDVPLELGEDREHAGQGPAARRGQVECLAERDEADLECGQFLERRDQIDQRTPPAV